MVGKRFAASSVVPLTAIWMPLVRTAPTKSFLVDTPENGHAEVEFLAASCGTKPGTGGREWTRVLGGVVHAGGRHRLEKEKCRKVF